VTLAPPTAAPTTTIALSSAEHEWCSFTGENEADARRFDQIFEAGLELQLNMDAINARAAGLRREYETAGMSPDEAVRAVSNELLEDPDFRAACAAAYARFESADQST
jgi:hypothetical protein